MSRALALVALTHLSTMPSEHPFMLELASSPLVKLPCSPPRTIQAFGRLAGTWWLLEQIGQRQRRQHFGTLQCINWLRAVSVGSGRAHAEAQEHRLCCTAVQVLLVAAHGPTCSSSHAGCTQGIRMLGSFGVAYSAPSARIDRVRMRLLQIGGAQSPRRSHDLLASADQLEQNRHTELCTI